MQNHENKNLADGSGSTGSSTMGSTSNSTGGSTVPVEPIDLDLGDTNNLKTGYMTANITGRKYVQKHWSYEELKLLTLKRFRAKIIKHFNELSTPKIYTESQRQEALEFFERYYPDRSPFAVYQRCRKFALSKKKKLILI